MSFAADVAAFSARAAARVEAQAGMLAEEILRGVQDKTPVRTGRARAGWKVRREGEKVIVENKVSYIGLLEHGGPRNVPHHMLALTLEEQRAQANNPR